MDEQKLIDALMKADSAGDTEAAQMFAEELKKVRAAGATKLPPEAQQMADNPIFTTDYDPATIKAGMRPAEQLNADARANMLYREYEARPEWQKPIIAGTDIMKTMADGFTFGFADKAAAGLSALTGDKSYEENLAANRQRTQDSRDRAGWAGTVADLAGGIKSGTMLADKGLTLMGRGVAPTAGWLQRYATAAATAGAEGSLYGAVDALGHDKDVSDGAMSGLTVGSLLGTAGEGVSDILGKIMSKRLGVNKTPTIDELRTMKDDAYKKVSDLDARYSIPTIDDMNSNIMQDTVLAPDGARKIRHPKTVDMVDQLSNITDPMKTKIPKPVSLYDLDTYRKSVSRDLLNGGDASEAHFGRKIVDRIDETMADIDPTKVTSVRGTPQEALDSLLNARDLNSRMRKAEDLSSAAKKAERRIDSNSDGGSVGNQTRQNVAGILNSDKRSLGFNDDEITRLESIVKGTPYENAMRTASQVTKNTTGKAILSGAGVLAGHTISGGNPYVSTAGAGAGMLGSELLSRTFGKLSERSTEKSLQELIDDISRGKKKVPSRASGPTIENRDALVRMLILAQMQQEKENQR